MADAYVLCSDTARPSRPESIEALRSVSVTDNDFPFTVEQISAVYEGCAASAVLTLDEIATRAGIDADQVLEIVDKLGSWLSRVKGNSGVKAVPFDEATPQPMLLQVAPAPLGKGASAAQAAKNISRRGAKRIAKEGRIVIMPRGFESVTRIDSRGREVPRDVSKAYASMIAGAPNRAELTRFLARNSSAATHQTLTFSYVSTVWFFAAAGWLDRLGEVAPTNTEFNRLLAEAYDILEVSRADAMAGLATLCSGTDDVAEVRHALARIRGLFEAEASRLDRKVELAERSDVARKALGRELRFLARRIESNPAMFVIGSIGELNKGQVMRIGELAGFRVAPTSRAEETAIRARLEDLGLLADADQLIPSGLAAVSAGAEEVFWDACVRRADGDPSWDVELAAALQPA